MTVTEPSRPRYRDYPAMPLTMKRAAIAMSVLCVIAIGFAVREQASGVVVVVRNTGDEPMHDVAVHVTGNSYNLGMIESGQEERVRVEPSSESHVEVSFFDIYRQEHRLAADCYFEPRHYHGAITIDIAGGQVKRIQDTVSIGVY